MGFGRHFTATMYSGLSQEVISKINALPKWEKKAVELDAGTIAKLSEIPERDAIQALSDLEGMMKGVYPSGKPCLGIKTTPCTTLNWLLKPKNSNSKSSHKFVPKSRFFTQASRPQAQSWNHFSSPHASSHSRPSPKPSSKSRPHSQKVDDETEEDIWHDTLPPTPPRSPQRTSTSETSEEILSRQKKEFEEQFGHSDEEGFTSEDEILSRPNGGRPAAPSSATGAGQTDHRVGIMSKLWKHLPSLWSNGVQPEARRKMSNSVEGADCAPEESSGTASRNSRFSEMDHDVEDERETGNAEGFSDTRESRSPEENGFLKLSFRARWLICRFGAEGSVPLEMLDMFLHLEKESEDRPGVKDPIKKIYAEMRKLHQSRVRPTSRNGDKEGELSLITFPEDLSNETPTEGMVRVYKADISEEGIVTLSGPTNEVASKAHKVLGEDRLLKVTLPQNTSGEEHKRMLHEKRKGVKIAGRVYKYFGHKDAEKESLKVLFAWTESAAFADVPFHATIPELRLKLADFRYCGSGGGLGTVAKMASRIGLTFSTTYTAFRIDGVQIKVVEVEDIVRSDSEGRASTMTDGNGLWALNLAKQLPCVVGGKLVNDGEVYGAPLVTQVRIYNQGCVYKGTLTTSPDIPDGEIWVRVPSMKKVACPPKASQATKAQWGIGTVEVVRTFDFHHGTAGKLNQQLLPLLECGAASDEHAKQLADFTLNLYTEQTEKLLCKFQRALEEPLKLWNLINKSDVGVHDPDYAAVAEPLLCGTPLTDPFLQEKVCKVYRYEVENLAMGKLSIPGSMHLMGIADPTNELKPGEVVILQNGGVVSFPQVLVYKSPGIHPGDVRALKARERFPALDKFLSPFFGSRQSGLIFSVLGVRSEPDCMAGSDLDGDEFLVITNPQLINCFTPHHEAYQASPSSSDASKGKEIADVHESELEENLFEHLRVNKYENRYTLGKVYNYWGALADRYGAKHAHCLKLCSLYFDALDAGKTGVKVVIPKYLTPKKCPSWMETKLRWVETRYASKGVLGQLHLEVLKARESARIAGLPEKKQFREALDPDMYVKGHNIERHVSKWTRAVMEWKAIHKNESSEETKFKLYRAVISCWRAQLPWTLDSHLDEPLAVSGPLMQEASCIYHVAYKEGKYKVAWHIAGDILNHIKAQKQSQGDTRLPLCVLRKVLSAIKTTDSEECDECV